MKAPLILADIDGTLLTGAGKIGSEVWALADLLRRHGGQLVPVSARPLGDIARLFAGEQTVDLAAGSGGSVVGRITGGHIVEVCYEEVMPEAAVATAMELVSDVRRQVPGVVFVFRTWPHDFELVTCGDTALLNAEELAAIAGARRVLVAAQPLHYPVEPLGISILARTSVEAMTRWSSGFAGETALRLAVYAEVRLPGWCWCETFARVASKQGAATRIAKLALSSVPGTREMIAVGDSCDDLGMMRMAQECYCPETADPLVKLEAEVLAAPGGPEFVLRLTERLRARLGAR